MVFFLLFFLRAALSSRAPLSSRARRSTRGSFQEAGDLCPCPETLIALQVCGKPVSQIHGPESGETTMDPLTTTRGQWRNEMAGYRWKQSRHFADDSIEWVMLSPGTGSQNPEKTDVAATTKSLLGSATAWAWSGVIPILIPVLIRAWTPLCMQDLVPQSTWLRRLALGPEFGLSARGAPGDQ